MGLKTRAVRAFLVLSPLINARNVYHFPQPFPHATMLVFITAISRSVYPTPDSSILVDLDAPACKRLTSGAFSPHEVIPLIEAIFTNQSEVTMIGYLRRDTIIPRVL